MAIQSEEEVEANFLKKSNKNLNEDDSDTKCGLWNFHCKKLQFLASKKSFILVYTMSAMLFTCGGSYTNGIISTLEKQYKLSSSKIGIMYALEDFISGIIAVLIPYYTSKGHFPRWISFGVFLLGVSLLLQSAPYAIYGPGSDALSLTEEFGSGAERYMNQKESHQKKMTDLCYANKTTTENCSEEVENEYKGVTVIIAIASTFAGCGQQFFNTLGMTYLDNNIKKSKIPLLYSGHRFVRLLAPAIGLNTASYFLKFYVAPSLHPTIKNNDPRWIGAWWAGYLFFAAFTFFLVPIMAMFPKTLPRAAQRKTEKALGEGEDESLQFLPVEKASFKDLVETLKRLARNKAYFCNTMAAIFYVFGYIPYNYFMNKYLQIQYLLTPSFANTMTGSVALVSSAVGMLTAGVVITIFKPRARYLAGWNIVTSLVSAVGLMTYGFLGCPANNNAMIMKNSVEGSLCNLNCRCDFVKYSPVCGENGKTYISACHAGCQSETKLGNGTKSFTNCNCINPMIASQVNKQATPEIESFGSKFSGSVTPSPCFVDCFQPFYILLFVLCINKFIGGTEAATNFLMGLRCVEERDKAVSIGLTSAIVKFCAVIPSPIVFGYIFDHACLLWGKTCSKNGNCWLYDNELIKYSFNVTAGVFILIGTFWDVGTWYFAKDIKIFDEKQEKPKVIDQK